LCLHIKTVDINKHGKQQQSHYHLLKELATEAKGGRGQNVMDEDLAVFFKVSPW
jgi:hypothetical protein